MPLSSLLSIARSALLTHQRSVDVIGHNIANAQTPGYTRQRLDIRAQVPLRSPWGPIGRGVTDAGAFRVRDQLIDGGIRRESGSLGLATTTRDLLGQVEGVFGEPSDTGLRQVMDRLFDALGDLANDPSSLTARTVVQRAGQDVAFRFRDLTDRLSTIGDDAVARLRSTTDRVNTITDQVARLNAEIRVAGGINQSAPDLEDQRDRLLDELSGLVAVRVIPRDDNTVGVALGDQLVVDGGQSRPIEVRTGAGTYGVAVIGAAGTFSPGSGSLRALIDFANTTLSDVRGKLDQLAAALVGEFNALHQTGFTATGATGTDFFDPTGTTAGTLRLAAPIAASPLAIAAGATFNPGDGDIALGLAQLRTAAVGSLSGATFGTFYGSVVGALGVMSQDAQIATQIADTLVQSLEAQRQSVAGVSVDEEMVNLISSQQAYAAAARLVTVADEMMQDLLRMV